MEDLGDIYKLTSPSGKSYIGQAKQVSGRRKHGYTNRWKQHIYEANSQKDYCVVLNHSIRKYGHENFEVTLLGSYKLEELNDMEKYFISLHNSMKPNGYNMTPGGSNFKQSEETCEKRRQSMLGKNTGKRHNKRVRQNPDDNELPKYVRRYNDKTGKSGYRISHHPQLKEKLFASKKITMEEKLTLALNYLTTADI